MSCISRSVGEIVVAASCNFLAIWDLEYEFRCISRDRNWGADGIDKCTLMFGMIDGLYDRWLLPCPCESTDLVSVQVKCFHSKDVIRSMVTPQQSLPIGNKDWYYLYRNKRCSLSKHAAADSPAYQKPQSFVFRQTNIIFLLFNRGLKPAFEEWQIPLVFLVPP